MKRFAVVLFCCFACVATAYMAYDILAVARSRHDLFGMGLGAMVALLIPYYVAVTTTGIRKLSLMDEEGAMLQEQLRLLQTRK